MSDVTRILAAIEEGDPQAAELLLPLVYNELRHLAACRLSRETPGQTLDATGLVHEAYLRLVDVEKAQHWDSRGHFFAAAAEAMRRILVEQSRKRRRRERLLGKPVSLDKLTLATPVPGEELLRLDEGIQNLEACDPVAAKLVKLRFFVGLTMTQAAEALGISLRTATRTWKYARSWLHRELEDTTNGCA